MYVNKTVREHMPIVCENTVLRVLVRGYTPYRSMTH